MGIDGTAKHGWVKVAAVSAVAIFAFALLTNTLIPAMSATAQTTDDASARVAKNKQYLAEADVLFGQQFAEERKILDNERAKENATSEQDRQVLDQQIAESTQKIEQIQTQIRAIEKLNQALFVVPPDLENKLYSTERELFEKYLDKNSPTYIVDNPVALVRADFLNRIIVIGVNTDKIAPDRSNIPTETSVNGLPVHLKFAKLELVSCTPYQNTGVCRPVIGGVWTAQQTKVNDLNTIGYAATRGGTSGVVIAGHTAGAIGNIMIQPGSDSTKRIGVVSSGICQGGNTCDFAFVNMDSGISVSNDLFITPSNVLWHVNAKRADSGQTLGTLVAKSGLGTAYTSGQIISNSGTVNYNEASFNAAHGDSGAPVFRSNGTGTAELFGMVFAIFGTNDTLYFPQDFIEQTIGAVATVSP